MKTWLKGGLIGAGIGIVILISAFVFPNVDYQENIILKIVSSPFYLSAAFSNSFFYVPDDTATNLDYNVQEFILGFLGISLYFLIGALIGLVIQKIKEKK